MSAHVVLEGNICAGKSTLCALLQKELAGSTEVRIQSELTEESFLTAFYGNMKKYGFAFQMFMFSSRAYQVAIRCPPSRNLRAARSGGRRGEAGSREAGPRVDGPRAPGR